VNELFSESTTLQPTVIHLDTFCDSVNITP